MRRVTTTTTTTILCTLLLSSVAVAGADCVTGTPSWQNSAIDPLDGFFVVTWTATPNDHDMEGLVALSMGAGAAAANYACLVRFNRGTGASEDGSIDVRNESTYQADAQVFYAPGLEYDFRAEIDVVASTYSVWVARPGLPETQIASDYAFRQNQQGIMAIGNWGVWAGTGSHTVCNFSVSYACGNVPSPPAGTIFVDASNVACPGSGTAIDPYCRIQDAICVASAGDEIVVAPGTYFEAINLLGKEITLRSSGGAEVTTLDGTGLGTSVVTCGSGETLNTVIEGITITGGEGSRYSSVPGLRAGGGIVIRAGSSATIRDCIVIGNSADAGGGIFIGEAGAPLVDGCTIRDNVANGPSYFGPEFNGGGGVYGGSGIIRDCAFIANQSDNSGGGYLGFGEIEDSLFLGNQAVSGGGVAGGPMVRGTVFRNNVANDGGGLLVGYHVDVPIVSAQVVVDECVFVSNKASRLGGGIYQDTLVSTEGGRFTLSRSRFIANTACCGGAINIYSSSNNTSVSNCAFIGNVAAARGGAIEIYEAVPRITNCTVVGNAALGDSPFWGVGGGAIWNEDCASGHVANCIIWGNGSTPIVAPGEQLELVSCILQYATGDEGTDIIDADPRFIDALGADGLLGTLDDDLRLAAISPAIDAGVNTEVEADLLDFDGDGDTLEPVPFDLAGQTRIVDGDGDSTPTVDLGSYERDPGTAPTNGPRWWTNALGGGFGSASNWEPGTPTSQDDAVFALDATYAVTWGADAQVDRVKVVAGDATFELAGTTFEATRAGLAVIVGAEFDGASASLTVRDGTLLAEETLVGDGAGRVELDDAVLDVASTTVRGEGELGGVGAILGDLTNLGRLDPGGSGIGSLSIAGDFTDVGQVPDGANVTGMMELTLDLEAHDDLVVGGSATLGGTLEINILDAPANTPIPVLTAGQIIGQFQGRIVGTALGGHTIGVTYSATEVTLEVIDINLAAIWDDGGDYSIGLAVVPTDAVLADFNNDGLPDIALTLPDPVNQVYVFFNNGEGSDPQDIFNDDPAIFCGVDVDDDPIALDAADLNGDGWIDLAVANAGGGTLQILINDQRECFFEPGPGTTISIPRPTDVLAGQVDAVQSLPDLVVASLGESNVQTPAERVLVLRNDGNLAFSSQSIAVSGGPVALAVGAFTGGSLDDVAVALSTSNEVQWMANDGSGNFAAQPPILVGVRPCYVEPEDLDRDGFIDLIVVNAGSSTISVLPGNGSGLDNAVSFGVAPDPGSIALADGGATIALIVSDSGGERVVNVYRNESSPGEFNFELDEQQFVGENPVIVRAKDVDLDGTDDLVAITDPASGAAAAASSGIGPAFAGFAAELQSPPCRSDFDGDGTVGFSDLTGLLGSWGGDQPLYDLDEDSVVGFVDLTMFLGNWGPCEGTR